jgi:hypothetical protein
MALAYSIWHGLDGGMAMYVWRSYARVAGLLLRRPLLAKPPLLIDRECMGSVSLKLAVRRELIRCSAETGLVLKPPSGRLELAKSDAPKSRVLTS